MSVAIHGLRMPRFLQQCFEGIRRGEKEKNLTYYYIVAGQNELSVLVEKTLRSWRRMFLNVFKTMICIHNPILPSLLNVVPQPVCRQPNII